jgi:hypothetical protein
LNKQDALIEGITQDIVGFIMADDDLELDAAMNLMYSSMTFEKLHDKETGLYLEGSAYVYELFKDERNGSVNFNG